MYILYRILHNVHVHISIWTVTYIEYTTHMYMYVYTCNSGLSPKLMTSSAMLVKRSKGFEGVCGCYTTSKEKAKKYNYMVGIAPLFKTE